MQAFRTLTSQTLVLPEANIDTDQIIPARFLTTTERSGLGRHAFADWRARADSPFADPRAARAQILVAGDNFGCGSSREHAPWALLDQGFRAVVSTSFADIFRSNALKNGLLPVQVDAAMHAALLAAPFHAIHIDLENCRLQHGDRAAQFEIPAYERDCLLQGRDDLDQLLARMDTIRSFEAERPAPHRTS